MMYPARALQISSWKNSDSESESEVVSVGQFNGRTDPDPEFGRRKI